MQTTFVSTTGKTNSTIPFGPPPTAPLVPAPSGSLSCSAAASDLITALRASPIYKSYERAFGDATGLPVTLRAVESWQLPHHGQRHENPFCALMASKSRTCAACLQVQQQLSERAAHAPQSVTCCFGLTDTGVPVRLGDRLIGFLQTGQVLRQKPTSAQFQRILRLLDEWGVSLDRQELREAFFASRVLSRKENEAVVSLLVIFAQHLSLVSNQIVLQQANAEPPMIVRARAYIHEHQAEDFSLGDVARAVHASTFYLCKMFKKATGVNFTDYVSRLRIEKARNLLLNPNLRVSEIAYEVGFQSLTHFNRVFKNVLGQSPTQFRARLRGA